MSAPGPDAGEVEDVADEPIEPVGLLEDGRQQLALLVGVVNRGGVEQARHPRFDRSERGAKVVRDGGEHRGTQLIRLGVELGETGPGVQTRAVEGDRRLTSRGLQQLALALGERTALRGTLHRQRAEGNRGHHHRDDDRRPAGLEALARRTRRHLLPVKRHLHRAGGKTERLEQHVDKLVEDPVGNVARQQLGRQVGEQPRFPLANGRTPALGRGVADDEPDHRRDGEEDDRGDHVAELLELETHLRVLDDRHGERGDEGRGHAGPDAAGDGGDRHGQHEDGDRGTRPQVARQDGKQRSQETGPEPDRHGARGDPVDARIATLGDHTNTVSPDRRRSNGRSPFTFSSRRSGHPSRRAHAAAANLLIGKRSRRARSRTVTPDDGPRGKEQTNHFPPSPSEGPAAPSSCRPSGISGARTPYVTP